MVSLASGKNYRISSNGNWLQDQFPRNGQPDWRDCNAAPHGLTIRDIKVVGNYKDNIECLMSDGRWYEPNGMNGFTLTWQEQQKADRVKKDAKKAAKAEAKANGKKDSSEGITNENDQEDDDWYEQHKRELEEENRKEEELELRIFGADFKKLSYKDKIARVFSRYSDGTADEELALDKLVDSIHGCYYEPAKEWFTQHKDRISDPVFHYKVVGEFVDEFPDFYEKFAELKNVEYFPSLKNENDTQNAGFFDLKTKLKNKQILKAKEERSSILYHLNIFPIRNILHGLEGRVRELLYLNDKFIEIESMNLSDSTEKDARAEKGLKKKLKDLKEKIESQEESVGDKILDLGSQYYGIVVAHKLLKKADEELYKLTNNPAYSSTLQLEDIKSDGLSFARNVYEKGLYEKATSSTFGNALKMMAHKKKAKEAYNSFPKEYLKEFFEIK
ncbi:MAG: hypothetical protein NC453_30845 [Muribaculum sp.]|nr:hypothetical protein [Muribaculum sp.]